MLSALSASERSKTRMFPDPESRRAHLERIAQTFAVNDDRERMRELGRRIDALYESGAAVPRELVDEFQQLRGRL